jgi:alkyl sulfatase BDS1-like metallo-beta-lactamase superfamily hydrolase
MSGAKSGDMLRAMSPEMIFDYIGIYLDTDRAQDLNLQINFNITGDASYLVTVKSGVLLCQKGASAAEADATVTLPKRAAALLLAPASDTRGLIKIEGDQAILTKLMEHMAEADPSFNIIEP